MTREQIGKVMSNPAFTKAEKQLLEYQYNAEPKSFRHWLFGAIFHADPENQRKLALGFPDHVDAVQHWQYGDLRQKMEAVVEAAQDVS